MIYIYIYLCMFLNDIYIYLLLQMETWNLQSWNYILLFAVESAIRAHDSKDFFGQQRCVVGKHGRLHVKALIPQDVAIMTQHLSKSERYASAHSSVYSLSQATWFKYQFVSSKPQTAIGSVSKISQNFTQKTSNWTTSWPFIGHIHMNETTPNKHIDHINHGSPKNTLKSSVCDWEMPLLPHGLGISG